MQSSRSRLLLRVSQAASRNLHSLIVEQLEDRCMLAGDVVEAPAAPVVVTPPTAVAAELSAVQDTGHAIVDAGYCEPVNPAANVSTESRPLQEQPQPIGAADVGNTSAFVGPIRNAQVTDLVFSDRSLEFIGPRLESELVYVALDSADPEFPMVENEVAEGEGVQPPVLSEFKAVQGAGNIWTFEGKLTHANPGECEIIFGGILVGVTVEVDADGTFSISKELFPYEQGLVTAVANDANDQPSNMKQDVVNQ